MNSLPPVVEADTSQSSELLAAVDTYIVESGRISAEQLTWLAFLEKWLEPHRYSALDGAVEEIIAGNVRLVTETVMGLVATTGKRLQLHDDQQDRLLPVVGIGYSTEQQSYKAMVLNPNFEEVLFNSGLRLTE